jgi:hypothetical protein
MVDCHAKNSMDDKARCGKRKMESLASRSQLAKSVFDYTEQKHVSVESVISMHKQKSQIRQDFPFSFFHNELYRP